MRTGRAYGFFNYDGRNNEEIVQRLVEHSRESNFQDDLVIRVLDKGQTMSLPEAIVEASKKTDVFSPTVVSHEPVKANTLSHIAILEAPEVTASDLACPPNYRRANQEAAGMLREVLGRLLLEKDRNSSKKVVFYHFGNGVVERY